MRVTHHNDIVPRIPMGIMNYRHSGLEVYYPEYNSWDSYVVCQEPAETENNKCINSQLTVGILSHLVYLDVSVAHRCGYLELLLLLE